ncbi:MAG: anion permease [Peptococcaceae bacterium]|nr:anion permease [Peptococcaceae bacterium]
MTTSKMSRKSLISWIVTIALPVIILLIPTSESFTPQIRTFFAITLMGIAMFCFDEVDNAIAGILMMLLYIITNIAPSATVFSAWTNDIPWYILATLLLVNILDDTTILKRIAYHCIIWTGGTYKGIIYGITLTAMLSIIIVPGTWTSMAVAAITLSIIKSLNLPVGKASGGILMAACFGFHIASGFIYSPSGIQMFLDMSKSVEGVDPATLNTNFIDFFWQDLPLVLLPFIMAFIITKIMKPEKPINGKAYFQSQLQELGRMSTNDKKVLVILLILLIYLLSNRWTGWNMLYGFLLAPIICYLPGIKVATVDHFRRINFNVIFFIVACLSIGTVAASCGAGQFIVNMIVPLLSDTSTYEFLIIVFIFGVLVNFLLTPMAAMSSIAPLLSGIALTIGVTPLATTYSFYLGLDQLMLPYEIGTYLIFFSMGYITLRDFAKLGGIKMAVSTLFTVAIMIPWWMFVVHIV